MKDYKELNIGIGVCGSFCTINKVLSEMKNLKENGINLYFFLSNSVQTIETRFGTVEDTMNKIKGLSHNKIVTSIEGAEPIGPSDLLDAFIIAPCTGNSLAKLANGIVDSPVLMGAKATLRNMTPIIIALATNDGLGLNLKNIGSLLNNKNVYFVPLGQDDSAKKKNSLVCKIELINDTLLAALNGEQIQPLLR